MKTTIEVTQFKKALRKISGVIDTQVTIPHLQYGKLDVVGGKAALSGSDLWVSVTTTLPIVSSDDGALFFPVHALSKMVEGIREENLTLESNGTTSILRAGRFTSKLALGQTTDFPKIDSAPFTAEATFDLKVLNDVLAHAEFAVLNSEGLGSMPVLQLEIAGGRLTAAGTDGHRIAIATAPTDVADRGPILIQKDAVPLIKALDGETAAFKESNNSYLWQTATTTLVVRKSHAKFPAYKRTLGYPAQAAFAIPTCNLRDSITRALSVVDTTRPGVTFSYDGSESLVAAYKTEDRTTEDVLAVRPTMVSTDPAVRFKVSAKYLAGFLGRVDGELTVTFVGSTKPVTFAVGDYKYLLATLVL